MHDYFAGVPTEVLATISSGLPTSDRHGRRFGSALLSNPGRMTPPRVRIEQQHLLKSNSISLKLGRTRRAQRLPLVCRRWRAVLRDAEAAWRTLQLHSKIADAAHIKSLLAFCARLRCVEVRTHA